MVSTMTQTLIGAAAVALATSFVGAPLYAQETIDDNAPLDVPYQDEAPDGAIASDDEVDFFDTLYFLDEEGTGQAATTEAGDPDVLDLGVLEDRDDPLDGIDVQGLPGLSSNRQVEDDTPGWGIAVFRGLDKVTARVWMFEAPIDQVVTFGKFEVQVRRCNKRPPEETPNTTAFVEVQEVTFDESQEGVFKGWMFAQSPGLNAIEHPVYDIWLIDCKMSAPELDAGIAAKVDEIVDDEVIEE